MRTRERPGTARMFRSTVLTAVLVAASPVLASESEFVGVWPEGPALAVEIVDNLALISNGRVARTYSIADPSVPVELGSIVLPGAVLDFDVSNGYAYAAVKGVGIAVVDLHDPSALVLAGDGIQPVPGGPLGVTVADDLGLVFVTSENPDPGDLVMLQMVSPIDLIEVGRLEPSQDHSKIYSVATQEELTFVLDQRLRAFDGLPQASMELGSVDTSGIWPFGSSIAVSGDWAYVGSYNPGPWTVHGIDVFDVSDPGNPLHVSTALSQGSAIGLAVAAESGLMVSAGPDVYLTSIENPVVPMLVGTYRGGEQPTGLALGSGVVMATYRDGGAHIIDVSNPADPTVSAEIQSVGEARDLAWTGSTVVASFDQPGIRLLAAADPRHPIEVANVPALEGVLRTKVAAADGIAFEMASIQAGSMGDSVRSVVLRAIGVSDPAAPAVLGELELEIDGWGLDISVDQDRLLVSSANGQVTRLSAIDVAYPASMVVVGTMTSDFHGFLAVGDGLTLLYLDDGVLEVVDTLAAPAPVQLATLQLPGAGRIVEGASGPSSMAYVVSDRSNATDAQLSVISLDNPSEPEVVGMLALESRPTDVAWIGSNRVAVATGYYSLEQEVVIVDVSFPARPVAVDRFPMTSRITDIAAQGELLAVATADAGISLWDLSRVALYPGRLERPLAAD